MSTGFWFDGQDSDDYGLHIIRFDRGFFPMPYISSQDIIEESVAGQHVDYFFGTKKQPYQFDITFSLLDKEFTLDEKNKIAKWLIKEEYKPFQIKLESDGEGESDVKAKTYYVIATNQSDFMSAGNRKGYFTISFRSNAPWAYQGEKPLVRTIKESNLSTLVNGKFVINNLSNVTRFYYPEIEFKIPNPDNINTIELKNKKIPDKIFELNIGNKGGSNEERIYIDNEREKIISNNSDTTINRLGDFNKKWLCLVNDDRTQAGTRNEIEFKVDGSTVNLKGVELIYRCYFPIYA